MKNIILISIASLLAVCSNKLGGVTEQQLQAEETALYRHQCSDNTHRTCDSLCECDGMECTESN